jgi:hypothetical protein
MSNWNEVINIAGLHKLYADGGITLKDLAKAIARKLKNTEAFAICDPSIIDVMCALDAVDDLARLKDYNVALDLLYDFGDKDHRLWIEADGISHDDEVVTKTRNPFDEITKPDLTKLHNNNNNNNNNKTSVNANEWISYPTSPKDKNPGEPKERPWYNTVVYDVGDVVCKGTMRYRCRTSNCNVDPSNHSFKPEDPWEYLGAESKKNVVGHEMFPDRITCTLPAKARVYALTRKYHYMSEDEFNKKLIAAEINPANMSKDLYSYMKDCEEPYQAWLILKWNSGNLTFRTHKQDV